MIQKTQFQSKESQEEVFAQDGGRASFRALYAGADSLIGGAFPWHWHGAFEIDYVAGCGVEFAFAGTSIPVPQGSAVFINAGEIHAYRPEDPKACRIYALLFDPVFLAGTYYDAIFEKYVVPVLNAGIPALLLSGEESRGRTLLSDVTAMIDLMEREPDYYELTLRAALSQFWCGLLEMMKSMHLSPRPRDRDGERIKQMLACIHANYPARLTLKDIAASALIGTRECSRCFQRSIGRSPMDYLNEYRIQMAMQQLTAAKLTVAEISEACGFSSISYFGKVFRRHTGLSPTQYRAAKT